MAMSLGMELTSEQLEQLMLDADPDGYEMRRRRSNLYAARVIESCEMTRWSSLSASPVLH